MMSLSKVLGKPREERGGRVRAIAADGHERFDAVLPDRVEAVVEHVFVDRLAVRTRAHLVALRVALVVAPQNRAADRQDARNVALLKQPAAVLDQPEVPILDPDNANPAVKRIPAHRADHRVEPGTVAPASQNANATHGGAGAGEGGIGGGDGHSRRLSAI
jgi:hypothetical protein